VLLHAALKQPITTQKTLPSTFVVIAILTTITAITRPLQVIQQMIYMI
jgi:hypothetical protein